MTTPRHERAVDVDAQDIAQRIRKRLPDHVEFLFFAYTADGSAQSVMSADDAHEVVPVLRRWLAKVGDIETFDRPHSEQGLALDRVMTWAARHEGITDPLNPERRAEALINRFRYLRERYAKDVEQQNKLIADPELAPREGTVPDIAIAYLRAVVTAYRSGDTEGLNRVINAVPQGLMK